MHGSGRHYAFNDNSKRLSENALMDINGKPMVRTVCYRSKAKFDWEGMQTIHKNIEPMERPRKKYQDLNRFVDTRLSYLFQLNGHEREEAMRRVVNDDDGA